MRYSLAKQGRVFDFRFEGGEIVHEEIERFAREGRRLAYNRWADKGGKLRPRAWPLETPCSKALKWL